MNTRLFRILCLILCTALLATLPMLAACGDDETDATITTSSEQETPTEPSSATEPTTDPATDPATEPATEPTTEPETEDPAEVESRKQEEMKEMYDKTEDKILPIGGWSTPATGLRDGYTGVDGSYDAAWQLLADAHLNYMITLEEWSSGYWTLESAASAHKAGMKLWYHCSVLGASDALDRIRSILDSEYADVLQAVYLKDEPTLNGFGEVKSLYDAVSAGLEGHELTYLANLLPTYAGSNLIGKDYRTYVRNYLETIKPEILMFDHYPYAAGENIRPMLVNNAIAIQEANRAGVPLYTFIQSSGLSGGVEPTETRLRTNVQVNLATGSKGIAYFTVCEYAKGWGYTPALTVDGQTTALYDKIKIVNEEVLAMKGVYLDYTCEGMMTAGYTGLSRLFKKAGCSDFLLNEYGEVTDVSAAGQFIIGCFANEKGEHGYYIVNMSEDKEGTARLVFDETCDKTYTLWGADGLSDMGAATGTVSVTLAPGYGAFLRLEPSAAE